MQWEVDVEWTVGRTVVVEADSEEEAKEEGLAEAIARNREEEIDGQIQYEDTVVVVRVEAHEP